MRTSGRGWRTLVGVVALATAGSISIAEADGDPAPCSDGSTATVCTIDAEGVGTRAVSAGAGDKRVRVEGVQNPRLTISASTTNNGGLQPVEGGSPEPNCGTVDHGFTYTPGGSGTLTVLLEYDVVRTNAPTEHVSQTLFHRTHGSNGDLDGDGTGPDTIPMDLCVE